MGFLHTLWLECGDVRKLAHGWTVWPSVQTMCRWLGVSRATVYRWLAWAREHGVIVGRGIGGRKTTSRRLNPFTGAQCEGSQLETPAVSPVRPELPIDLNKPAGGTGDSGEAQIETVTAPLPPPPPKPQGPSGPSRPAGSREPGDPGERRASDQGRLESDYRARCERKGVAPPRHIVTLVTQVLDAGLTVDEVSRAWGLDEASMAAWHWSRGTNVNAENIRTTLRRAPSPRRLRPGGPAAPPDFGEMDDPSPHFLEFLRSRGVEV